MIFYHPYIFVHTQPYVLRLLTYLILLIMIRPHLIQAQFIERVLH
jgi:hypothetical protein